jgi:hypothetical protein
VRVARDADAPAVPDEQVREGAPVLARDEALEVALDLDRVVLLRQAKPLGETAHVGVDDDPLGVTELGCDHVRSLACDPG